MKITKELALKRAGQIVEHKKEMVERAKEYASVDIYSKYGTHETESHHGRL